MTNGRPHPCLEAYRGANAVVLGAAGFIGRWVGRALCDYGARLTLVVRNQATAIPIFQRYGIHGRIVELNLEDEDALPALFEQLRPTIVFNLAGYGVDHHERDEARAYLINARLVQHIAYALSDARDGGLWRGQVLVHAGSSLEYGAATGDLSENTPPQPTTFYGQTKLAGTCWLSRYAASTGLRALTARLFTVYGPGEHQGRLLPSLLETARTGRLLPLPAGTQKRDFLYVAEAAEGLLRLGLSNASPGEIVNLATGRLTRVRDFVETAARILGIPPDRLGFQMISSRFPETDHREVAIQRLRQLAAWTPTTSVPEGITQAVEFFQPAADLKGALS